MFAALGDVRYFITAISHLCFSFENTVPFEHSVHERDYRLKRGRYGGQSMQVLPLKNGLSLGQILLSSGGVD